MSCRSRRGTRPATKTATTISRKAAAKYHLRLDVPIKDLTAEEWTLLHDGRSKWYGIKGFFEWLETKKYKIHVRVKLAKFRSYEPCPQCHGSRLKVSASYVTFRDRTINDLFAMNVRDARRFWEYLPFSKSEEAKSGHLRREIVNRLTYLDEVGLSYLTLDRQTRTLSGGESQRINLAAALGSSLTETMYVIDEPTVGLHARDSERLLAVLKRLRNAGNTVIVVEHDPTIIAGADQTIELGPGAGEYGGSVLYVGPPRPTCHSEPRRRRGIPRPSAEDRRRRLRRHHHPRRARTQPQEHRRDHPARPVRRGHRRLRLRQVDADPQLPLQPLPARRPRRDGTRGRSRCVARRHRQDLRHAVHRSVADRPLHALESGHVREGVG